MAFANFYDTLVGLTGTDSVSTSTEQTMVHVQEEQRLPMEVIPFINLF
jgi:hypothetical protein